MNTTQIIIYKTGSNKEPYSDWADKLDLAALAVVKSRLNRVRLGNLGDAKLLKNSGGIWEFRINYGPGYRVYFGKAKKC